MTETRTILRLKPNVDEATKPRELIQVNGHQELTLASRRAITILWHEAHRQGIEKGKSYTIPLSRLRPPNSESSHGVDHCILQLMKTILFVKLENGKTRRVAFLGGNDMDDPDRPEGMLTYHFDTLLVELLRDSFVWGKIELPVLMSFSSKYAISLYENIAQWVNLDHKTYHDFTLEEFRQLLGVEDGKYKQFGALNKQVLQLVVAEINGLAPFNVTLIPIKTSRKITDIRVGWWRKSEEELKEAYAELQRSRVGRKARIMGKANYVADPVRKPEDMRMKKSLLPTQPPGDLIE